MVAAAVAAAVSASFVILLVRNGGPSSWFSVCVPVVAGFPGNIRMRGRPEWILNERECGAPAPALPPKPLLKHLVVG